MTISGLRKIQGTPAAAYIPLDEAKRHLRVSEDFDDDLIVALTQAAVDIAENYIRGTILPATWEYRLSSWQNYQGLGLPLPVAPLLSISTISYAGSGGTFTDLDADKYVAALWSLPPLLAPVNGSAWPSLLYPCEAEAVRVTFISGYGPARENVPEAIAAGVKLILGHLYEHREDVTPGVGAPAPAKLPNGAEWILMPYRWWPIV